MAGEGNAGPMKPEGMGWRVGVSIVTFFGAIIAVILWLFFFAGGYNAYQNIAVVIVIILAFIAIMGATWASWGMKQQAWWSGKGTT
jgi:protein-S-isoprenylcysteine O-methyltransferase Ste14